MITRFLMRKFSGWLHHCMMLLSALDPLNTMISADAAGRLGHDKCI